MNSLDLPEGWKTEPELARRLLGYCARQGREMFADGAIWLAAILVLGVANAAVGLLHLPPAQMEMMEAIHLNAVYATILVAAASTISRVLMSALERLGHWEQAGER